MPKLGVNIDHIATLRQLRKSQFPDCLLAAKICEINGADSIVAHLREDRRHIQDSDVVLLRRNIKTKFNLEMSISDEIVRIACRVKPDQATLVPEKRQELTTEGGLNVIKAATRVGKAINRFKKNGIDVSLFIEPDNRQIKRSKECGAGIIELHTGRYANSKNSKELKINLEKIENAVLYAHSLGLIVNAGHGLNYANVSPIARIANIHELNIGYSIICRAVFTGLGSAAREMKKLVV